MSGTVLPIGNPQEWTGGRVTDWSTCLLAPNPSAWTLEGTNTWLIAAPESSSFVVVDPGPDDRDHLERIVTTVSERGEIAQILLTHGHADHSAGALSLSRLTGAPVRALDPDFVHGSEGLHASEVIVIGDLEIEVIASPGHSADCLSFRVNGDSSILTGDTVLGRGTTVIAWPEGRLGDYLTTLGALAESVIAHDVTRILPGHGPVVADPAARIDAYLQHRAQRLEDVRVAQDSGARTAEEIVAIVYATTPHELLGAATLSVRAQLDFLTQSR